MSLAYDNYIREHRENLRKGLLWMQQNLSKDIIDGFVMEDALSNAEQHDESKYSKEEYDAYDAYFYGDKYTDVPGQRPKEVRDAFDYAWLHHIHENPHHWQHWVLLEDDPNIGSFGKVLEMPLVYIYEMIADWWTFSWRNNNLMEVFSWYESHIDTIKLGIRTRMIVERILDQMYKVLKMQMVLSGAEDIPTFLFAEYERSTADEFGHSGIKGQKWHVRRYQYPDGRWTEEGKARRRTVFVSGSSKTQDENSGYFRKSLPDPVKKELDRHMKNEDKILVGDAPGIDRQVQDYLNENKYKNVEVFGPGTEVRYSANKDWKTNPIDAPEYEKNSKEWLAAKDKVMTDLADEGLAVILDEGAKATRKNILRLADQDKYAFVYQLSKDNPKLDKWLDEYGYLTLLDVESEKLEHSDTEEDPHRYGVPELKKFPMPDRKHVRSAIRFFNYIDPKHEEELAKAILSRMEEFGMSFEDFGVGDENRFKKYIPKKGLEELKE